MPSVRKSKSRAASTATSKNDSTISRKHGTDASRLGSTTSRANGSGAVPRRAHGSSFVGSIAGSLRNGRASFSSVFSSSKSKKDAVEEALEGFQGGKWWADEDGYAEALAAATGQNYVLASRKPILILQPSSLEDVALAWLGIEEARLRGLCGKVPFTVCGGGHSELCCVNKAVLVHLTRMNEVKVYPKKNFVVVGGGSTLGTIKDECAKHGLACAMGTYHTVGAGLLLQGGIGKLTRYKSLSVDNILEVEMVLPSGEVKVLNAKSQGPDAVLFWAVRGAGPCFGIVTKMVIEVHPVPAVLQCAAVKKLDFSQIEVEYLAEAEETLRRLPDHQACDIAIGYSGTSPRLGFIAVSLEATPFPTQMLNQLELEKKDVKKVAFHEIQDMNLVLPEDISMHAPAPAGSTAQTQKGVLTYVRNMLVDEIGAEGWKVILDAVRDAPSKLSQVSLQHAGGVSRDPVKNCWGCRSFEYSVVIMSMWEGGTPKDRKVHMEWADQLWNRLGAAGLCIGTYPVDIDPFRRPKEYQDEATLAFGFDNVERLREIKAEVDPDNMIQGKYL